MKAPSRGTCSAPSRRPPKRKRASPPAITAPGWKNQSAMECLERVDDHIDASLDGELARVNDEGARCDPQRRHGSLGIRRVASPKLREVLVGALGAAHLRRAPLRPNLRRRG